MWSEAESKSPSHRDERTLVFARQFDLIAVAPGKARRLVSQKAIPFQWCLQVKAVCFQQRDDEIGRKWLLRDSSAADAEQNPSGRRCGSPEAEALKPHQHDASRDEAPNNGQETRGR
jgi:hypothetical protein